MNRTTFRGLWRRGWGGAHATAVSSGWNVVKGLICLCRSTSRKKVEQLTYSARFFNKEAMKREEGFCSKIRIQLVTSPQSAFCNVGRKLAERAEQQEIDPAAPGGGGCSTHVAASEEMKLRRVSEPPIPSPRLRGGCRSSPWAVRSPPASAASADAAS